MKKTKAINQDLMEFNKPSELCQMYYIQTDKITQAVTIDPLSSLEHDLINIIMYIAKKHIIQYDIDIVSKEDGLSLTIPLAEIASYLKGYANSDYEYLIKTIDTLSDKRVRINALDKVKESRIKTNSSFILKSKCIQKKRSPVHAKLLLDSELCALFLDTKKYFSKMFFSIQLAMSSKYSKLLYELLKDYEGIKSYTIPFAELTLIMNTPSKDKYVLWYNFNDLILKKAVAEINTKSDIVISYEPLKEKVNGRLQVVRVKFNIEKQSQEHLTQIGFKEQSVQRTEIDPEEQALLRKATQEFSKFRPDMKAEIDNVDAYLKGMVAKNIDKYKIEIDIDYRLQQLLVECDSPLPDTCTLTLQTSNGLHAYYIRNNYTLVHYDLGDVIITDKRELLDFLLHYESYKSQSYELKFENYRPDALEISNT